MGCVAVARVLVVDDEPSQRFLMRRILELAGHIVDEAGHGADAIDSVNAACPDLVVTDIMMPVMDGVELIHRLRTDPATTSISILAVSGHAHLAEGADRVLSKPYEMDQLIQAADALLQKSGDDVCLA